jgi:hypothetical protein
MSDGGKVTSSPAATHCSWTSSTSLTTPTSRRPCQRFGLRLVQMWRRSPPCRGPLGGQRKERSRILLTRPTRKWEAFPSPSTSSSPTSRTRRSSRRCRKRSVWG